MNEKHAEAKLKDFKNITGISWITSCFYNKFTGNKISKQTLFTWSSFIKGTCDLFAEHHVAVEQLKEITLRTEAVYNG